MILVISVSTQSYVLKNVQLLIFRAKTRVGVDVEHQQPLFFHIQLKNIDFRCFRLANKLSKIGAFVEQKRIG